MPEFEAPYIHNYSRDYITYFNIEEMRTRLDLLNHYELWQEEDLDDAGACFLLFYHDYRLPLIICIDCSC